MLLDKNSSNSIELVFYFFKSHWSHRSLVNGMFYCPFRERLIIDLKRVKVTNRKEVRNSAYLQSDLRRISLEVEVGNSALRVGDHLATEAAVGAVEDVGTAFRCWNQGRPFCP